MAKKEKKAGVGGGDSSRSPPPVAAAPGPDPRSGLQPTAESRGRYVPLLYPGAHGRVDGILIADWGFGWSCHWDPISGTQPHETPDETCPYCRKGQLPRWSMYVPCLTIGTMRHRVMQISSDAWLGCPDLSSRQGQLRGLSVTLQRTGTRANGRVSALVRVTAAPADLPAGYDVRPVLSRLWGRVDTWLEEQCGPYRAGVPVPGDKRKDGEA